MLTSAEAVLFKIFFFFQNQLTIHATPTLADGRDLACNKATTITCAPATTVRWDTHATVSSSGANTYTYEMGNCMFLFSS